MDKNYDEIFKKKFMLKMYDQFWKNIRKAEESSWKIFISYSVIIILVSFLYQNNVPLWTIIILIIGLTAIAISITLNANLWFLRNMVLITRLEKVFKPHEVIPKRWKKFDKSFINDEIWTLHLLLYIMLCTCLCLFFFSQILYSYNDLAIVIVFSIIIILSVICYGFSMSNRYKKMNKEKN